MRKEQEEEQMAHMDSRAQLDEQATASANEAAPLKPRIERITVTVSESVTRECCDPRKDLRAVLHGSYEARNQPTRGGYMTHFCIHCGRHWEERYVKDEGFPNWSGSPYKPTFVPVPFAWELP